MEERKPPQFPTMLRKMWTGAEVQQWINENWYASHDKTKGGKTGWPPGMLQDDCGELNKWLASRLDARQVVRNNIIGERAVQAEREQLLLDALIFGTAVSQVGRRIDPTEIYAAEADLKPCRSPYCECSRDQCTHPGYYDARHEPLPNTQPNSEESS